MNIPLTEAIIIAVSKLVDDAQTGTRQPSHYDIETEIRKSSLINADPNTHGSAVGKAKRIRAVLNWAIENDYNAGEKLITYLLELLRGVGGFRCASPNYIGAEAIANAIETFRTAGIALGSDGVATPVVIDNLPLVEQEEALKAYIQRAQKGAMDSALLVGTGKDLLEAVSGYVIQVKMGTYPTTANFPTLLGQAFTILDLATPSNKPSPGEPAQKRLERALYETGCAINQLRNKQGTGHGHPFVSSITTAEGNMAIKAMGTIAEYMMSKL
jgi:hypothetical protein